MDTLGEYKKAWGENGLKRFSRELLQIVDITEEAKHVLTEIGLPLRSPLPLGSSFVPLSAVSTDHAIESVKHPFLYSISDTPYRAIGYIDYNPDFGHDTYFCAREGQGTIHLLDNEDPTIYLVNSSLSAFVNSLLSYHAYLETDVSHPRRRNERLLLRELRQSLRLADAETFKKRSSYWPLMLADLAVQI